MKKILLAVTAALAITGCSQNEEFENAGQNAEIKIGTSVVTRATPMVTDNFAEFRAFGYAYKGEDAYAAEGQVQRRRLPEIVKGRRGRSSRNKK